MFVVLYCLYQVMVSVIAFFMSHVGDHPRWDFALVMSSFKMCASCGASWFVWPCQLPSPQVLTIWSTSEPTERRLESVGPKLYASA